MTERGPEEPGLVQRTGRAAFWNALLIPLLALLGLAFSIVVRRNFGLGAGVYDTALGMAATLIAFSGLGIPGSLTKFLPEIELQSGAPAVGLFLKRVAAIRLLVVAGVLLGMNLLAEPLALRLDLGIQGILVLRFVSALIVARVLVDLAKRTLNAFFEQLRTNLLDLTQGVLDFALVGGAVYGGYTIAEVFGMLVVSSIITAVLAIAVTRGALRRRPPDERGSAFHPSDPTATRAAVRAEGPRFLRFAAFTYLFQLTLYFSDKGFASLALAGALGTGQVALFASAFQLAFMTVGLMVAGFRGVYRPMFAHLRARRDPDQLRRAFSAVSKAQLVLLVPAAVGLAVLAGDYVPLLYGPDYAPAVPIARVLVVLLYTQTAFNLGIIWLSVDERYRAVMFTQSILVVAAPLFLLVADRWGLVNAALLFGGARAVSSVVGYLICHRRYGFRFPWRFAVRVGAVAAVMGVLVLGMRTFLGRSPGAALFLTLAGAVVYLVGLRLARVLGPEEIDLLQRADIPGGHRALAWLAPAR